MRRSDFRLFAANVLFVAAAVAVACIICLVDAALTETEEDGQGSYSYS